MQRVGGLKTRRTVHLDAFEISKCGESQLTLKGKADLFKVTPGGERTPLPLPLSERLRPRSLAQVVGQQHVLGPSMPLRLAFESGRPHSCILWGPPGVGQTTIARLMADAFGAQFISISAVLGGVKDIREAVGRTQAARDGIMQQRTIVFADEMHRFSKAVKSFINQQLRKPFVRFLVLPHCSLGVTHG
jgi:putative ATPase